MLRTTDGRGRDGYSLEIPVSTFVISSGHEMSFGERSIPENVQAHDSAAEADWLDLVACIYDAALDPDRWPATLERVVDTVGGAYGIFPMHDQRPIGPAGRATKRISGWM